MNDDKTDSLFLELEKVAKRLSIGDGRASAEELRRLFHDLRSGNRTLIEAILPSEAEKPA